MCPKVLCRVWFSRPASFTVWVLSYLINLNDMKRKDLIILIASLLFQPVYADKVLVTIGETGQVTEQQLEAAMQAAPFATQFPSMDEQDQAYLRGDMLLRLARAEALYQEAVKAGKQNSDIFKKEMGNFKTSLLARKYLAELREQVEIPPDLEKKFATQFNGHSDALTAARSAYIAKQFNEIKNNRILQLKKDANVKTFFQRLDQSPTAATVLAEGKGVLIKYGDLIPNASSTKDIDKQQIIDKVNEWITLLLTARAAEVQGMNVDAQMQEYAHNLTTRLLLTEKEQHWIPDEKTLLDYFQKNPDIGYIPERRQIGQIVLATKQDAEAMQTRIKAGESLFILAGEYSVDPYGRQRSGDMGWLTEGSGAPEIEQAIKQLKDNEVSDIVKTNKGWHLVTIVNRKPSERKSFADIKDRVRQKILAEKMTAYLQEVTAKHPLQWNIPEHFAKN